MQLPIVSAKSHARDAGRQIVKPATYSRRRDQPTFVRAHKFHGTRTRDVAQTQPAARRNVSVRQPTPRRFSIFHFIIIHRHRNIRERVYLAARVAFYNGDRFARFPAREDTRGQKFQS